MLPLFLASKPMIPFGAVPQKSEKRQAILPFFKKRVTVLWFYDIFRILTQNLNYRFQGVFYEPSFCDPKTYDSVRSCTKKVEKTSSDIAVFLHLY